MMLLTAFAILTQLAHQSISSFDEIFVRAETRVSVQQLAKLIQPIGRIERREGKQPLFLVRLRPGLKADEARQKLENVPGVRPLEADQEPVDMRSMRSLDRKIRHMMADEKREQGEKRDSAGQPVSHEKDGVDYLAAYQYFVGQRAFPDDRVNWGGFETGRVHASKMPSSQLNRQTNGAHPFTTTNWEFVGPTNLTVPYSQYYGISPVNGRINSVTFDPNNSQTIYAGGAQGGLWRSLDTGATWNWLSTGWDQLGVNQVVVDPNNSNTIYVARGDYHGMLAGSFGILKSTDGGVTWSEIAIASMGKIGVDSLLIDPTNSQILIAGTGDADNYGKLYRSTNGGTTWTKLPMSGTDATWPALASTVAAGNSVRFYTVAAGFAQTTGSTQRLYKSDDHGATWQPVVTPVVADGQFHWAYAVATSPTNANNVYLLDSEGQALYTSTNAGSSWVNVSADLPTGNEIQSNYNFSQSFYDYHLEVGSRNASGTVSDVLYLGEIDLTESLDGGRTWTSIGGPTYSPGGAISHNDQHCLAVSPTNPNFAVFSNDGGVYSVSYNSSTNANTVTPLSKLLGVSMFYKIAMHPTNANFILGGTQDNASPVSTGDLSNWLNVGGGDGGGSAINQQNPNIQYTSSEYLSIYATTDSWTNEKDISPFVRNIETTPFVCAMVLDPSNPNLMYTGTNYLYQWNQTTQTWATDLGNKDLTNLSGSATIQAIAVAPTDSNRIYTGSSDGALYMSKNQGKTWTKLNVSASALPKQAITSVSVSGANESDILVGISGVGKANPHLYRCTNTTLATPIFTNVSGTGTTSLPDVSLNAICRDLDNPLTSWWVGTDTGVFLTVDAGKTWSNAGSTYGLPSVFVLDLVAVPGTRYINAGTYGRGLWRLQLPAQTQAPKLTTFTVNPSAIAVGGSSIGTVSISLPAPTGGFSVGLTSSVPTVATVPEVVVIPAGATSATFTATASSKLVKSASTNITASAGTLTLSQNLSVVIPALQSVSVLPTSVVGGNSSAGTVTLVSPAPAGGATIQLRSSNTKVVVPSSVTVSSGQSSGTFTVNTQSVTASTVATISATLGAVVKRAVLTVKPLQIQSISVTPTTFVGGSQTSVTGTVTLAGPAPAGGQIVKLTSTSTRVGVSASIVVPAGSTTTTFNIVHCSVLVNTSVTIRGACGGVTKSATIILTPILVSSVVISPAAVVGGNSATGTVKLNVAPGSGTTSVTVRLVSSTISAVPPTTVVIPAGSTSQSFTIKTKAVKKAVAATVTATLGSSHQKATLQVTP